MDTDLSGAPGTDTKFWDGFLEAVRAQGGSAPYDRWYVIRAEQYLKAYRDTPLSRHRPEEVSAYLTEIGRKGSLKDWQFRQVVDALEALFCKVAVAPWAGRFDWGYWKDSARSLEPHHATIVRDVPLPQASGGHDRREAAEGLGPVRGTHGEVLHALIAEILRRAYSTRTEQAYEHWLTASSPFAATGTHASWAPPRSGRFSRTWPCAAMSRPARRIRRSMPWCSSTCRY